MAFTPEEERDIKRLAREAVGGTPLEQVEEVDDFESGDLVPFMKYDGDNDTFKTAKIAGTNIGSGGGGGGGEPSQYLKDASVSQDGNTLTLTKKNNSTITFAPNTGGGTGTVTGVKVGSEGSVINPTQGVVIIPPYESGAQAHIAPTASEVKTALGTGSGTTKYLREDGEWATPAGGGGGGNTADVNYDATNKKITKTIDGVTSDVVTVATLKTDMNLAKGDVGLDNVGNFKAVSTEASQGLTDTEKGNARTNIGAGTSNFSGSYNDLTDKPVIDNFVSSASQHLVRNDAVGLAIETLTSAVNLRLDEQDDALELLNGNEVIVVADHTAVQSPDSQKIYREQDSTSYTDWMYQNGEWKKIATYSFPGTDNEPTPNSNNVVSSDGLSKIVGYYIENPEYIRLLVDANNRILLGIKKLGVVEFETDALFRNDIKVKGNAKIDGNTVVYGQTDFRGDIKVKGDAELEGDTILYGQSDFRSSAKIGDTVTEVIQNEEFIRLYTDKDNRILFGVKRYGGVIFGGDIIKKLRNEIAELVKKENTDKGKIPDTMILPEYTYVVATYDLYIAKTDESLNNLYFSDDLGATWSNPVVIPNDLNPIRHAHFFSDGTLLVCGTRKCAYITPFNPNDRTTFHYSEIYDVDGNVYNPTRDGFYTQGVSNDVIFCKDNNGNDVEVKVFGDYTIEWDYNGNGVIDREDMEAMHPRLWCTTDRGRTIRCIFESGVSEIDGEVITIRHFHHVDYCKKTNKFYISTGDFDQDEYAPDDPRHINYTQNYFLEASFTTDNNNNFDWSFDIIGSGKSFKIGGFWFDDNYAYFFTDYTTGKELKPKGILRCPIDGLRNFDNYKNIYRCPPDEWGSIAPIGMVEDNNGNKVLFPDYLGYGFIWVATEGYNFKKVRLDKYELIGYDRIGPNANGDMYITRSTGDSYPKGWDRNAPWYSLNALLKNNGINGFFKKTNK